MKIDYPKTFAISAIILFAGFTSYSAYTLDKKLKNLEKTHAKITNKYYPVSLISDIKGKRVDSTYLQRDKVFICLSMKCPFCIKLLKSMDASSAYLPNEIFPLFKASPFEVDSFAKANNLNKIKLYHSPAKAISREIKSVPTFLILDKTHKIKKIYNGVPKKKEGDSLVYFVNNLLHKNQNIKSEQLETCH